MNAHRIVYIFILSLCVCSLCGISVTSAEAERDYVTIQLTYGDVKEDYTDRYIEPDNFVIAQQLFERGVNLPYREKMGIVEKRLRLGADYRSALVYSFPLLSQYFDDVIAKIERQPIDSEVTFLPDEQPMFVFSDEKNGIKVNEGVLYRNVFVQLKHSPHVAMEVPTIEINPKVTKKENQKNTRLRSKYATDIGTSSENRRHNIETAMQRINGIRINGGEAVSFNGAVGPRTEKNGFKEAKIIVGGKYVNGYGGGVCQASTTLYNAALLGGLKIDEVHRHTLKSSYELPSFDAMVNSGTSDLKVRNDGENPVYIRAFVSANSAVAEIYGSEMDYVVERESVVTFTGETPPYEEIVDEQYRYFTKADAPGSRKAISYSHPEVHSEGYLNYYTTNGKLIRRVRIRKDVYSKVSGVIAIAPDNDEYFAGWRVSIKIPENDMRLPLQSHF